ncbi:MAG: sporulation integral membrane protein YtvI [Lachnospiraceae bacterium]|nr:sporulation integral membrane protein YtvI [Lachnospiraceae bacterium]
MEIGSRGRKVLCIIGITAGVYLTFRFLLPLVIPFLIAYLGAGLMAPAVHFLERKLRMKRSIAVVFVGLLFFSFLGTVGLWLARTLMEEVGSLIYSLGNLEDFLNEKLRYICGEVETNFGLKQDTIYLAAATGMTRLISTVEEKAMPLVMSNSLPIVKALFEGIAVVFITLVSTLMICKDYDVLQEKRGRMLFAEEFNRIGKKISGALGAYLRTQGILIIITAVISVAGLFILKNPYALLLGITIGILDALPFIGTGIIYLPWAVLSGIMGDWRLCVGILVIYGICYLVRELLEPKLMGKQIGMTSLEMIVSMYIGIRLFGLGGVVLGPIGYLMIVELSQSVCEQGEKEEPVI